LIKEPEKKYNTGRITSIRFGCLQLFLLDIMIEGGRFFYQTVILAKISPEFQFA